MRYTYLVGLMTVALTGTATAHNRVPTHIDGLKHDVTNDIHSVGLSKRALEDGVNGWGTFDQLISHKDPKLGTFKQRVWWGTEYWGGPGSPIILINGGEGNADGRNESLTTNSSLAGRYAEENNGAVLIIEHRFWGDSSPYDQLTVKNLTHLTLENSLEDMVYFAKNWKPPFDTSGKSAPDKAPWVYLGCSYPGALAGWLATLYSGTFWAYHGSSAVIQTVSDFSDYYKPAMTVMPKNCSADVTKVIDHIDDILLGKNETAKGELKTKFGSVGYTDEDFALILSTGPNTLQSNDFNSIGNTFHEFCNYVENVWLESNNTIPDAKGVGLEKALEGYARWINEFIFDNEPEESPSTTDDITPADIDISPRNSQNRQWDWMLCNEPFEWWQTGGRADQKDRPSIISRLVTADYRRASCETDFPPEKGTDTVGVLKGKRADDVNEITGGWNNTNAKRLMYSNGQYDPWRDATMASTTRPGGPLKSCKELPHLVIEGGSHCSDWYTSNYRANAGVAKVVDQELDQMKTWIDEFYTEKKIEKPVRMGEDGGYEMIK